MSLELLNTNRGRHFKRLEVASSDSDLQLIGQTPISE